MENPYQEGEVVHVQHCERRARYRARIWYMVLAPESSPLGSHNHCFYGLQPTRSLRCTSWGARRVPDQSMVMTAFSAPSVAMRGERPVLVTMTSFIIDLTINHNG